ncbi:hypothetical protein LINPERHAP1_LOCUS30315, partial [Linum perenne]
VCVLPEKINCFAAAAAADAGQSKKLQIRRFSSVRDVTGERVFASRSLRRRVKNSILATCKDEPEAIAQVEAA